MKSKKILVILSILAVLFMLTTPVLASSQNGATAGVKENYKGTITFIDATSIEIKQKGDTLVTISLSAETVVKIPTKHDATLTDLKAGMKVTIKALRVDDVLTAKKIILIPGKPTKVYKVGVVTDYQPGISITIQAKNTSLYTFLVTAETKILPADQADKLVVGAVVTIIAPRDVTSLDRTAKAIVIHLPDPEPEPTEEPTAEPTVEPTEAP